MSATEQSTVLLWIQQERPVDGNRGGSHDGTTSTMQTVAATKRQIETDPARTPSEISAPRLNWIPAGLHAEQTKR